MMMMMMIKSGVFCYGGFCLAKSSVAKSSAHREGEGEDEDDDEIEDEDEDCLLYTSPSPRDYAAYRMPSSA